ncbi:uncharacterized protein K444DRAFT_514448, partial [Hyaloscypha bicolor E]
LPTRVLELSSTDRLILRNGRGRGIYCAYSGVAGGSERLTHTTTSNIMARMHGIPLETLPTSWRDAALLARRLGFRYIWIEGLCVIHDDEQSWREEFVKISDYYRKATLVIASAHSDSSGALQRKRSTDSTLLTAWAKRGWTIGERYLASRMLIIGNDQIYWNCNQSFWSEGSTVCLPPLWRIPGSAVRGGDRSIWYNLVEYHTSTEVTFQSDRLVSLSSLAIAFASGNRYWAGIWQDDLHVGLLWRRAGSDIAFSDYAAPSWSWAS